MPGVPFVKASACGNDFLIVDMAHAPADIPEFTRRICDRHNGVGADGVEFTMPAEDADVRIRLWNADGSEAEISGNGTRCVAAWYCAANPRDSVLVRTDAGVKRCDLIGREGNSFRFRSAMGEPVVNAECAVSASYGIFRGVPVSMGNPHFVIYVAEFSANWQDAICPITSHPDFAHGTNVELVRVLGPNHIDVRFCERGVGETRSSGTGSCAAAVACIATGKVGSPVQVKAPGGTQTVEWDREVFLTGPATLLCRGEFFV